MSPALDNRVWGWLLASCFTVLIGCSILTVNAHITLNEYQATRSQDIAMMRQEIVRTSLAQSDAFRMQMNGSAEQLKQYIDVQVPMKARDAIYSVSPININQTANPATTISPTQSK